MPVSRMRQIDALVGFEQSQQQFGVVLCFVVRLSGDTHHPTKRVAGQGHDALRVQASATLSPYCRGM
jgi:hypothetical protein